MYFPTPICSRSVALYNKSTRRQPENFVLFVNLSNKFDEQLDFDAERSTRKHAQAEAVRVYFVETTELHTQNTKAIIQARIELKRR